MRILALSMLLFPVVSSAQVTQGKQTITDALKNADCAFRRFEEVTTRVDFDRWRVEESMRAERLERLQLELSNVRDARKMISRIESSREPASGVELLYFYSSLVTVETELTDLSTSTSDFQLAYSPDTVTAAEAHDLVLDLARASATATTSENRLLPILTSSRRV